MGKHEAESSGDCYCVPEVMADRMCALACGCDALVQALDCMRTAVRADPDSGLAFVGGMLEILLFSAERVQQDAQLLVDEAGSMSQREED